MHPRNTALRILCYRRLQSKVLPRTKMLPCTCSLFQAWCKKKQTAVHCTKSCYRKLCAKIKMNSLSSFTQMKWMQAIFWRRSIPGKLSWLIAPSWNWMFCSWKVCGWQSLSYWPMKQVSACTDIAVWFERSLKTFAVKHVTALLFALTEIAP